MPPSERLRRPLMRLDAGDDGRRAGGALIPRQHVSAIGSQAIDSGLVIDDAAACSTRQVTVPGSGLWADTMERRPVRRRMRRTTRDGRATAVPDFNRHRDAVRTLPPKTETAP